MFLWIKKKKKKKTCFTVCISATAEDLLAEWFYSQKDIFLYFLYFSFVILSINMKWKTKKWGESLKEWSGLRILQCLLENNPLKLR